MYQQFLESKKIQFESSGFTANESIIPAMAFEFQKDIIKWATYKGKAAIFAEIGLGKTLMQLAWAKQVAEHTNERVLILAPLAVSAQTTRLGQQYGINVNRVEKESESRKGINITNYDKLHLFDPLNYAGIILDESSCVKDFTSKTCEQLINSFRRTPYRLACTATPAPNDYMELANHAEFLGVMNRSEMLAQFFIHDGGDTAKWRLKKHAEKEFWRWVATWACVIKKPSDLGYEQKGYDLPKLHLYQDVIEVESKTTLFPMDKLNLQERREARKDSLDLRVELAAKMINESSDIWLVWCDLNTEGDKLEKLIDSSVQIAGKDSNAFKEQAMLDFADGKIKCLITKGSICGFGMNFQVCSHMAFVGLGDSYEIFKQAIGRIYRYGQTKEVHCHIITSSAEGVVVKNIQRKQKDFEKMIAEMSGLTVEFVKGELQHSTRVTQDYKIGSKKSSRFELLLGDCVQRIKEIPDNSIDFSIFSPPFSSLYTYSNLIEDMGNCRTKDEFFKHFAFLTKELYRIMKPGRLVAIHCMNLQRLKSRDGDMGIEDFRGDLIRMMLDDEQVELQSAIERLQARLDIAKSDINKYDDVRIINLQASIDTMQDEIKNYSLKTKSFIFHSEVCIWKDPVTAMQRTKSLKLLYKQLKKDSTRSGQGLADYLLVFMKPGENQDPVTKDPLKFPVSQWQKYASPVWMDINPSNTLQKTSAREEKDEKHIAPLQLEVISRALELWTNPDDLVFTPFAGIGSEVYQAVKIGRRGLGIELKQSYYNQAVLNCQRAEVEANTGSLFDFLGENDYEQFGLSDNNLDETMIMDQENYNENEAEYESI